MPQNRLIRHQKQRRLGMGTWTRYDEAVSEQLKVLQKERPTELLAEFCKLESRMSTRGYWYMLGVIWSMYAGTAENELWRALFSAKRPFKSISLMKPEEYKVYAGFTSWVDVFRPCHEDGVEHETFNPFIFFRTCDAAYDFGSLYQMNAVVRYEVPLEHVDAYFNRLRKDEVLVTTGVAKRLNLEMRGWV